MKVNFNNVRKQAIYAYDRLCDKLNKSIEDNKIIINVEDIQEEMDELRMTIGTIGMCYQEDDDEVKNVYDEIYPEDKSMKTFNEIQ